MALLYDIFGNPLRSLPAVGGDSLIDERVGFQNIGALNGETVLDIAFERKLLSKNILSPNITVTGLLPTKSFAKPKAACNNFCVFSSQ